MTISSAAVVAHLWQSTLFAAAIALVTLALRRNRAAVRHALWLAASLKFLVPFAALTAFGSAIAPRWLAPARIVEMVVEIESRSLAASPSLPLPPPSAASQALSLPWPWMAGVVWFAGVVAVIALTVVRWRRVRTIARAATPIDAGRDLDALR